MSKVKIIIVVVSMVILSLFAKDHFFNSENNFISNASSYITKPIGTFFSGLGWWVQDKTKFVFSIGELKGNNQKLFDENLILQAKVAKLSEIEKENGILREELLLAPREQYKLEAALVIGRESGDHSEIIHINKGYKDGIRENMAVLVGEAVLIGKVIKTTTKTAKIRLITDKDFRANAKLVESDGRGVVFGQYGTSATMKMISQTVEVNKGDKVITSELSNNFVKGLLIGYVQEVFNTADGLFQEAIVLFPKELENLHLVWVLMD